MNTKKRKNMKPEERRSQLLDCAQKLFFGKGYEDTTITDIMNSASVSKGGFYHHFSSKDELLLAVFERLPNRLQTACGQCLKTPAAPPWGA